MNWTSIRLTVFVRLFAFLKIPLLGWVRPSIVEMNQSRIEIKIPLTRRTKNHLNSMYFGALCMGGEAAVAVRGVYSIMQSREKIDFIFKDFNAEFLKRADGSVHFICDEVFKVDDIISRAKVSHERIEATVNSYAVVPSKDPTEKVARFSVTMSVKNRGHKNDI